MSKKADYELTVGLEIHAELKTVTKMFCNSKNDPEERRPNVNVCPICMGHPGTLPVINNEAVKHVLKVGMAVGGEIADFTEFDRKNYFYPDIPKGYQISQYAHPLVKGGSLAGVLLTRIHLEEDTARSTHEKGDYSLVDFNRAGVPLMELVTQPVIHSAVEASRFARELQMLLIYLGASDANMEKGEMRVEANISVGKDGKLGTKVEVKNLNSFRAVERAIEFEMKRHIALIEKGEKVVQETRGWDENKEVTFSQRLKEESHDYRYFPDPDLPKLHISNIKDFEETVLAQELPELPWQKRERLVSAYDLKPEEAEIFIRNVSLGKFFEEVIKNLKGDKKLVSLATNYVVSDLIGLSKNISSESAEIIVSEHITSTGFAKLMIMVGEGKISSRGAKDILKLMHDAGGMPEEIAKERNLFQQSDTAALTTMAKKIIETNTTAVEEYKKGKEASLQFLVGQGMKESKGSANPTILKELFISLLK